MHLGEDVDRRAGELVYCIGNGRVVYRGLHPGTKKKGDWGNVVMVRHRHPRTGRAFYSLYGHLAGIRVRKGHYLEKGDPIGRIARGNTPENGHWPDAHLHFALYTGPWRGKPLPGFFKRDRRGKTNTQLSWWRDPTVFIRSH